MFILLTATSTSCLDPSTVSTLFSRDSIAGNPFLFLHSDPLPSTNGIPQHHLSAWYAPPADDTDIQARQRATSSLDKALSPLIEGSNAKRVLELASYPYEHIRGYAQKWSDVQFTGTVRDDKEIK